MESSTRLLRLRPASMATIPTEHLTYACYWFELFDAKLKRIIGVARLRGTYRSKVENAIIALLKLR